MSVNGVGRSSDNQRFEQKRVENREKSERMEEQSRTKAAQKSDDTKRSSEKGGESKVDLTA